MSEFLDRLSAIYTEFGIPGGLAKTVGSLMEAESPLSVSELSEKLEIPEEEICRYLDMLQKMEISQKVGENRFQIAPDAFDKRFQIGLRALPRIKACMQEALDQLPVHNQQGQANLSRAVAFMDFMEEELGRMQKAWQHKKAA